MPICIILSLRILLLHKEKCLQKKQGTMNNIVPYF